MGLGRAGLTHDSLATLNKLVRYLVVFLSTLKHPGNQWLSFSCVSHFSPLFKLTRLDAHHASTIFCKVLSDEYSKWSKRKKEIPPFPTVSSPLALVIVS